MTNATDPPPQDRGVDWRPPRQAESNLASIVFGVLILAIGVWYLLDQTLGFEMPRVRWADLWPIFLIVVGIAILFRSARRRT